MRSKAALLMAAVAAGLSVGPSVFETPVDPGFSPYRYRYRSGHTPHQGEREMARRRRQMAKLKEKRDGSAG